MEKIIGIQKPTGKLKKACLGISPLPLYHFPLVRFLSSSNVGPRIWTFFTFHRLQYTKSLYYTNFTNTKFLQTICIASKEIPKIQNFSVGPIQNANKQKFLFRCTYITYIVNDRSYSIAVHSMTCKIVSGRSHYGVKLQQ